MLFAFSKDKSKIFIEISFNFKIIGVRLNNFGTMNYQF